MIGKTTSGSTTPQAISDRTFEEIIRLIESGDYPPGARFLSERELASALKVSRPTVRQAISSLVQMGYLESRQGSGTTVARSSANLLKTPFELLLLLDQPTVHELYEVRELIEVHLAERAAIRRTPDDLAAIETQLQAMRATIATPEQMTEPNIRFHEAVAAAAHLPILERFVRCLCDGIRVCVETTRPAVRDWEHCYRVHEQIYRAIHQGDGKAARRAMLLHMAIAIDEVTRIEAETEAGTGAHP